MLRFFVEFGLEFQGGGVGFDGADGFDDLVDPGVHQDFAEFPGGEGAVAGIVVGESGVPPDSGVDVGGEVEAILIGAGLGGSAVEMDKIGTGDERLGAFALAGMHIGGIFDGRAALG